ncbi:MAG: hypothetical protein HOI19_16985, partial [Rhodospirillaceae bacterium]|nr:hypothetical protein [Rhodospirillaceae bacterium]
MNIQRKTPSPSGHAERTTVARATSEDVCRMMTEILGDGVDIHRCLAAQALGRIGAPLAVGPLIEALLDEDSDVRTDAAEALSNLADPRSAKQLLENLLGDPCTEVKLAAIKTLAALQDTAVTPWLRRIVKGRDEEIAWDEDEFYDSGWDDWVDVQVKAVGALATLNAGEAVPDIVAAMSDENAQDMTEAAFKALARMDKPGIDALAAFLDEESTRLRRRAAAALAASNDAHALEPLSRAIADSSGSVRLAAMRALAVRAPTDARLAVMLDDPDEAVRCEAVRLCGGLNPDRLPAMLADEVASVQIAVLAALTEIPDDEVLLDTLRDKMNEEPTALAAAAAKALGAMAPEHALGEIVEILGDAKRPVDVRLGALQGLAASGRAVAVPPLINLMNDDARSLRLEAMSALTRIARKDPVWPNAAGTALILALSDDADEAVELPGELVEAQAAKSPEPE